MQRRSLSLTLNVSDEDHQVAERLMGVLIGKTDQDTLITNDVLFAFERRYEKSFFAMLAEALTGETLLPETVLTFDIYALTGDRLDELKAAIAANPLTSYRLKLNVVEPSRCQNVDHDLQYLDKIERFKTRLRLLEISHLMRQQNTNRIRMNWYQMQCGFFGNTALPRDVLGLILNHVRDGDQHPHPRPAREVIDNLSRIREDELQRRNPNGSK